jgi:hypothetical protein
MGLLTSPKSARRQVSGYVTCGFAYTSPYTLTPGQPSPGRATFLRRPYGLPTTSLGRVRGRVIPKDRRLWLLSIARFGMGACKRS